MNKSPIDFDSPLGISKREWTKVLGVNLALLLVVYLIALICTLCGSDFFLLQFNNDGLQSIENTLRTYGIFALVQILVESVEICIIIAYISKWRIKFWIPLMVYGSLLAVNLIC